MKNRIIAAVKSKEYRFALVVILVGWLATLAVGLITSTPMIGDEVTHYYMLVTQADRLPAPCFDAVIPGGLGGESEVRHYPHTFLWHYMGAILYKFWSSPILTQLYQSFFLLQLLLSVLYLTRGVAGFDKISGNLAMVSVVSLPMVLIFSVAFYLDVPATAQIVTAVCCLLGKRWIKGALFLSLAVAIKENMILFLPGYLLVAALLGCREGKTKALLSVAVTMFAVFLGCWFVQYALKSCAQTTYYPADMLKVLWYRIYMQLEFLHPEELVSGQIDPAVHAAGHVKHVEALYQPSNHPGDLRIPRNWLIYGGGVFWALLGGAAIGMLSRFRPKAWTKFTLTPSVSMFVIGVSYMILVHVNIGVPEARFFLPGVVFCCIASASVVGRSRWGRLTLAIVTIGAVLQSGVVLKKTYELRRLSPGVQEAIEYLARRPPVPNKVFMYPEGNYRFFPSTHTWYLGGKLKSFWQADNEARIRILRENGVGAIVIKKYMVGRIDPDMNNLGVYPETFLRDLRNDPRFSRELDNDAVTIYRMPQEDVVLQ